MCSAKQMQAFDKQGHAHLSNECTGQAVSSFAQVVAPALSKDSKCLFSVFFVVLMFFFFFLKVI